MSEFVAEQIGSLNEQLLAAAARFSANETDFASLLMRFAQDIQRAEREPLEIFPVAHHSPASGLHMLQRLRERAPRAIYLEMCEDMRAVVENLADCSLPVALQAFAAESDTLPPDVLPMAIVAPITQASAEYQAIAYALTHPDVQLVFVDRAADFVLQWDSDWQRKTHADDQDVPEAEEAGMHGTAVGVTLGALEPTFDEFLQFLLRNSNTRHFTEWWENYVERAIIDADYATYRQVMFLVGSLIRYLGRRRKDVDEDRLRERYMWTRMKQHMREHDIAPQDALYICGAAHTASDVAEFGTDNELVWEIPLLSNTHWLYGLIPSSYTAIDHQFGHPFGTTGLAEESWQKQLKVTGRRPFDLKKPESARRPAKPAAAAPAQAALLTQVPLAPADQDQLLGWSARIVELARKNGYLASTADSIAIFQTSLMLAQMRNRPYPSAYDFQDAAITCLEKDRTPKKRTIAQLCQILLGGDRVGTVGYASLPPLAQNVYDRLAPLGLNLLAKTNQRALMDFKAQPELRECSELLWKLNYLLGTTIVEPIVGERKLGLVPVQESWDIRLGRFQRELIQLGYEGVTLEQVLEQRMKRVAFGEQATAAQAFMTAEQALLFMNRPRLVRELGEQATLLLAEETGAQDAPDIFSRARRLVHYYHGTPGGLPEWIQRFVATGYAHYATLLPHAFDDRGTTPQQIAGMLGFIFTLESFALALGSQRSQLLLGVQQAGHVEVAPDKLGLLWAAEWLLNMRSVASIREHFQELLIDATRLPTLPGYLSGFVLALTFAPGIARLVVELISAVFSSVPDMVLLPLLPGLVMQLREQPLLLQPLIKEAAAVFPGALGQLASWQPDWMQSSEPAAQVAAPVLEQGAAEVRLLLEGAPATANALAAWLGVQDLSWAPMSGIAGATPALSAAEQAARSLLLAAPATLDALGAQLG